MVSYVTSRLVIFAIMCMKTQAKHISWHSSNLGISGYLYDHFMPRIMVSSYTVYSQSMHVRGDESLYIQKHQEGIAPKTKIDHVLCAVSKL